MPTTPRSSNTYLTLLEALQGLSEQVKLLATKEDVRLLREELHKLQESTYSKDLMDEKLRARDARIDRIESGWLTLATRIGGAIGTIWAVLSILKLVHLS